ncbi:hypothetical protein DPMN_064418 [Dreissena polymorpha]|uniref:Uncharacterized protein n=1 Tax=Dreissena polymorpha TaxID=45954 RepID=A0A9D4HJF8_DREPO|nr:hypothetical protein DPMN_064418 [Dreissena polymorpha]
MSPMFPVKVLPSANAGIYDDDDLASYLSQSQGDDIRYQGDFRDKRGMCRPGFTYQAILRDCVPSLGALRDRNRTGRGRRGLMSWYR